MPVSEAGALPLGYTPIWWQGQSDSNTQPVVLETTALPIELYPRMVMPAGLEPAISSLRGWRPNQLDDGTRWRYGPDSNRRNNSFAGCPLKPLEYRIMEIRAGLEPVIATVKGLCPNHLDERTVCREQDSLRIMQPSDR